MNNASGPTAPEEVTHPLAQAAMALVRNLKEFTEAKPDREALKKILYRFCNDAGWQMPVWLYMLRRTLLSKTAQGEVKKILNHRTSLGLDGLLQETYATVLLDGGWAIEDTHHESDRTKAISRGIARSPFYGIVVMSLLGAGAGTFCHWLAELHGSYNVEYFRTHAALHEDFSLLLLAAYSAEEKHVAPAIVEEEVRNALRDVGRLLAHVIHG